MDQSASELQFVRNLIPQWYAARRWAEDLIVRVFEVPTASLIPHGRHAVPGSNWICRTHGIGVDLSSPSGGGIDFDFDKPDPDPWRLGVFARKLLQAGLIPSELHQFVLDDDRFDEVAEAILRDVGVGLPKSE